MEVVIGAIKRVREHAAYDRLYNFLTSPVMRVVIAMLWIIDMLLFFGTFYWFYDPFMKNWLSIRFYNHCDKKFGIEKLEKLSKGNCRVKGITVDKQMFKPSGHYLVMCAYNVKVDSLIKNVPPKHGVVKFCEELATVHNLETSHCRSSTFTSRIIAYDTAELAQAHRCNLSLSMNSSSTDYTYQSIIPCFIPTEVCPHYVLEGEEKLNYCAQNNCTELASKTTVGMSIALSLYIVLVINCIFCCPCKEHRHRNRMPAREEVGGEIIFDHIEMQMLPGEAGFDGKEHKQKPTSSIYNKPDPKPSHEVKKNPEEDKKLSELQEPLGDKEEDKQKPASNINDKSNPKASYEVKKR